MRGGNRLKVMYHGRKVGTLAFTQDKRAAFEYSGEWLESGFSISPFSLPLKKQVFVPVKLYFQGLFGVFADSLPDAWGNLLLGRMLRKEGISIDAMSPLDRLAIVGSSGMGALVYQPEMMNFTQEYHVDLDELAVQCRQVPTTEYDENLDELYRLGGTSGGARPKILTKVENEDWIIKFPAHVDGMNAGQMEYEYSLCAKQCGIHMSETRLFPSKICKGYFGTKRFDRGQQRVHMCTAAALLELDYNQPSLDYHSLMKLTKIITGDAQDDMDDMYRRMCFNVFAHNRDDHSKNFAFLYDENKRRWKLSPAYDLTYSNTYYGEHTTSVDGNGRNPGVRELVNVGTSAGMKKEKCLGLAEQIKACVEQCLGNYLQNNGEGPS